jgi:predicted permease
MKPLETLYWLRFILGIVAAFICIGYGLAAGRIPHIDPSSTENFPTDTAFFMNATTIPMILYLLSYYIIKPLFILKVENPQKIFTVGIGIYFLSWLVFFTLLYTIKVVA